MLTALAVENYRSLRQLVIPLGRLNVVTGANGTGKSSVYRALRLLADSSRNGAVAALAREGGLPSTLWAGPETISRAVRDGEHPVQGTVRRGPVGLRLGFTGDDFGYALDLGLPMPSKSAFGLDPEIKRECVWSGPVLRPSTTTADRHGSIVKIREAGGSWYRVPYPLQPFDSMLSQYADPARAPELLTLREQIRSWRFYDHFRTDADAPARSVQVGTRTPVLGHDGADLAAALQTICEIGDASALIQAIDHAFPGSGIEISSNAGRFTLTLRQHGLLRPLSVAELSDGTLRYLLWVAALLTPRPPALLVLNEPETSLHPDLLPPLAELVLAASAHTQRLADDQLNTIELHKEFGETLVKGQGKFDHPPWQWPKR